MITSQCIAGSATNTATENCRIFLTGSVEKIHTIPLNKSVKVNLISDDQSAGLYKINKKYLSKRLCTGKLPQAFESVYEKFFMNKDCKDLSKEERKSKLLRDFLPELPDHHFKKLEMYCR